MKMPSKKYSQDLRRYYRMPAVQTSLTLVLSLFVMAFFIVFALRPTLLSIVTLKKTIIESEKTLDQLEAKITNLQKASAELDTIKPLLQTLNTDIPNNGARYAPLSLAIETLAYQSGVKIDNSSLGPTLLFSRIVSPFTISKNQSVVALPFNLRVLGGYPSILAFLTNLLSMERVVMVESVTISNETATKDSGPVVALNVSGSAYYLADEAQLQKSLVDAKGAK